MDAGTILVVLLGVLYYVGLVGWVPFLWMKTSGRHVRRPQRIAVYAALGTTAYTLAMTFMYTFLFHVY